MHEVLPRHRLPRRCCNNAPELRDGDDQKKKRNTKARHFQIPVLHGHASVSQIYPMDAAQARAIVCMCPFSSCPRQHIWSIGGQNWGSRQPHFRHIS